MESEHKHSLFEEDNLEIFTLVAGAIIFAIAVLLSLFFKINSILSIVIYVIAYITLGFGVLKEAFVKLIHGELLDEDFLMSLASIAAFFVGEAPEAVGLMLFFRIGELFEDLASEKSEKNIIAAIDMRPETVLLVNMGKDGVTKEIPASHAMLDDVLLVRAGDRIPLDGVVVDGESMIDTSPITGESVPELVLPGKQVISGCINLNGTIRIKVTKLLKDSAVSRIIESVKEAAETKPKVTKFITKFSRIYTPIVIIIAILTAIVPSLITWEWHKWLYTAVSFLVISCPCALVISVPLAFFIGIGTGGKHGILFKSGSVVEALCDIDVVAMDKTGTLTKGNFEVSNICPSDNYSSEELLSFLASAESTSNHPIAKSIVDAYRHMENGPTLSDFAPGIFKEESNLPISPKDVNEVRGSGIIATVGEDKIIAGKKSFLKESGISVPDVKPLTTVVYVAVNDEYAGYVEISDSPKEDAEEAVNQLHRYGLKVAMLTGDNKESARNIADQTGVDKVLSRLLPNEKLEAIKAIRSGQLKIFKNKPAKKPLKVLFVGDGINDAPTLAGADVSMAMGMGADVAVEAADCILLHNFVMDIPRAYKLSNIIRNTARFNIAFAIAIKVLILALGLCGFASMWMSVFADTGVTILCILNSLRLMVKKL